ncbi:MAG: ATP-binding protein [Bdellovibrionota bacterium]
MNLVNLSLRGEKRSFDSMPTKKRIEDVSFNDLKLELEKNGKAFEERDLKSFGLVDESGVLTVAGVLFADGHQLYQSRVFCTRWNGLNKANGVMDALDDKEFEGNLLYLLSASLDFVKRNNKKMWKKDKKYRIEYSEYPERAVQEAVVNALIHRDYAVVGAEIHIDIYDDRLEVYSPGGMYDGTFIQNVELNSIASARRNPIIADLFARINLMERRGSGLKKIVEIYKSKENYLEEFKPEFMSTETSFFTILKNLNYVGQNVGQNERNVGQNVGQNDSKLSMAERRKEIISLIKENSNITAIELSKIFNVSVRTIERDLSKLTEAGKIEYLGSAIKGKWRVIKA